MSQLKQQLILNAAKKADGKSGKELGNVMMTLILGARKKGIQFSSDEIHLILSLLKEGKTEKEQAEIDQMIQFARTLMKKNPTSF